MRLLLNVIWVVFGGFWLCLGYILFGLIALIPIVTIPASLACFRIAGYVLWPFVSVWLRESSGSFHTAFLMIPVFMIGQAVVVWLFSPENAGKDLDAIHT